MKGEIGGTSDNHDRASSSLVPEQLLHRAIGFADRVAVIRRAGEICIRKRDPTVRLISQDVVRVPA